MRSITIHLEDGDEELEVDDDRPQTPVLSPGEALEAHLRTCQWLNTASADRMFRSLYKREAGTGTWKQTVQEKADIQRAIFTASIDTAETIYVSPDMVRLTEALADEYGARTPLLHLPDVPTTSGLVVLGGYAPHLPYLGADGDNDGLDEFSRTRAFLFRLCAPGAPSFTYKGVEYLLEPRSSDSPMERLSDHGGLLLWDLYDGGNYLTGPDAWADYGRPNFIPTRTCAYAFDTEEPWVTENNGPKVRRFVGTLFQLMQQRVMFQEDWKPNRATARRVQRELHRLPLPGEEIKVTHLRRAERALGEVDEREQVEGGGWKLDHTIIVKEHPRDQWYPSLGPAYLDDGTWNPASHRKIQIAAHTRGEGPLVEKHSITAVVR